MDSSYKFLRECRIRHYQNMSETRALDLLDELQTKKAKNEFKKRINACKREQFIK